MPTRCINIFVHSSTVAIMPSIGSFNNLPITIWIIVDNSCSATCRDDFSSLVEPESELLLQYGRLLS